MPRRSQPDSTDRRFSSSPTIKEILEKYSVIEATDPRGGPPQGGGGGNILGTIKNKYAGQSRMPAIQIFQGDTFSQLLVAKNRAVRAPTCDLFQLLLRIIIHYNLGRSPLSALCDSRDQRCGLCCIERNQFSKPRNWLGAMPHVESQICTGLPAQRLPVVVNNCAAAAAIVAGCDSCRGAALLPRGAS